MSTSSQLRFVQRVEQPSETDEDAERVAQGYRNSDGSPGSVLRDLAQLTDLLDATRAERVPADTAATFVSLDKLGTIDLYLDGDPERRIAAPYSARRSLRRKGDSGIDVESRDSFAVTLGGDYRQDA